MSENILSRILRALCVMVALSPLSALSSAQAVDKMTVTDVMGRTVEVPQNPQRILLGFYFEDFMAISGPEAFKRVVAISRATWEGWRNTQWKADLKHVPEIDTLIDIGEIDSGSFNIEAAIAARPDVAILAAWQYRGLGDTVEKLTAAGIPIVVADYNAQTVEKHVASTLLIGKVTGNEARAQELATQYETAVADILARVKAAKGEMLPKVYVELGRKGAAEYDNSYAGTMWAEVIGMAGGDNIADGKIERWGPLNPEYVVASHPDMILIAGSGWAGKEAAVLMGFGIDVAETKERLRPYLGRHRMA